MAVSDRIKEEHVRLGATLEGMGELAGVGKTTVINWEKGNSAPNAEHLAALSEAGFDVLYIVTGVRGVGAAWHLAADEAALVDNYRHSPPEARAALRATGAALAQSGMRAGAAEKT